MPTAPTHRPPLLNGAFCPVTGLPVVKKPEWIYTDPSVDYQCAVRVIGNGIIHNRVSGHVSLSAVKNAIDLVHQVVDEHFGTNTPYVQIEDYAGLYGSTIEARRYFIKDITARPNLAALICCNVTALFKVNIRLAMRLVRYHFQVEIADDYAEAVKRAGDILGIDTATGHLTPEQPVCPVSSLPVVRKPEWTHIDLGNGYSTTFEFIGDNILLSRSRGEKHATAESIRRLFDERRKVIDSALEAGGAFFELRDYTYFDGVSSKAARKAFVECMARDRFRIIGFAGFNAPLAVRLALRLGKWRWRAPFPVYVTADYRQAMTKAVAAVNRYLLGQRVPARRRVSRPLWQIRTDDYRLSVEVIDDRILHVRAAGLCGVEEIENSHDRIVRAAASLNPARSCYYVAGVEQLQKTGRAARIRYMALIKEWLSEQTPIRRVVFYGANPMNRAALSMARPFLPFAISLVKDRAQAMELVERDMSGRSSPASAAGDEPAESPAAVPDGIQQYVDELLRFLGSIRWEGDGIEHENIHIGGHHPFRQVFDALYLIKNDLDEMFHERSEAEKARLRLATAIEQSMESFIITDADGHIQYVNPIFEKTSGFRREDIIGSHLTDMIRDTHQEDFIQGMWETARAGKVWHDQLVNRKADGGVFRVNCTFSPIFDENGQIINFVATQKDVTHELELETQLRQRRKIEAIGTLAGGIAHDFNNILYPIIGFTEMTQDRVQDDPVATEYLNEILTAAHRARDLVKQILTFSRQSAPEKQPIEIRGVAEEAIRLLRASVPSTVTIDTRISEDPLILLADSTQIHQVILNLGTNAYHAMAPTGGRMAITIEKVTLSDEPDQARPLTPGAYIRLSVADTGMGIDPAIRDRIFDPFFTTKEPGSGLGMGLSIVHGIVSNHGGHIRIDSKTGSGTTVEILLPMMDRVPEQPPDMFVPLTHTRGLNVLVVDDERQIVRMLSQMLEQIGCHVAAFHSSADALEAFREAPDAFDLVISDLTMPELTGEQFAVQVEQIRKDIPVIICTGFRNVIQDETPPASREYLPKPILRTELYRAIGNVMEKVRERR